MIRTWLIILILFSSVSLASAKWDEDQKATIVAHTETPEDTLERKTIERIFLGKKTRWSDDSKIVPVILKEGEAHEWFIEEVVNKPLSKFITFWKQAVFTGKGTPPKSFKTEAELLDFVRTNKGAIGYISQAEKLPDSVKQISVEK